MIQSLRISNYAIIDKMNIELSPGLNIITGETGAGKSILLGATGLILGQRAQSKSQLDPKLKTVIEGVFSLDQDIHLEFFERNDLDFDSETIIRREIAPNGKSRAFINDTPVSLHILSELAGDLVDLHQQFDTLELQQESFQTSALDALAGHGSILKEYQKKFEQYKKIKTELKALKEKAIQIKKEEDFLQFQFQELNEVSVQENEEVSLESEQGLLSNTEKIQFAIAEATHVIEEGEQPIMHTLRHLSSQIGQAGQQASEVLGLQEKLEAVIIDLEDWSREAGHLLGKIESDPSRLEDINSRLSAIYKLFQKHSVQNSEQLIQIQDDISNQIEAISNSDHRINELVNQVAITESKLTELAAKITKKRKASAKTFEKEVIQLLGQLHMKNAILKIDISEQDHYTAKGKDQIQFLFSANQGGQLLPIKKVASGGELSRLSLCIKSVVAEKMNLPTLIFDEIDSGISGEVALKMGGIIEKLGSSHQILMITHSPQIASRASNHLFIRKKEQDGRTMAAISQLDDSERTIEIAKMLSGDPPSKAALLNAKELLNL